MLTPNPAWEITDSSKVQDFIRCRRFHMYRHIFGWESESISNHLVFGEAYHLPMEHFLLNGYGVDQVIEGHELLEKKYRETFKPETDELFEPKTPQNAFLVLTAYAKEYKNDLQKYTVAGTDTPYTEIAGSVSIGTGKQIYFRMDSILRDNETRKIFSLEHKTGSNTYLWDEQWELSPQVGTYTHVLNCLFDPKEIDAVYMNASFFFKVKNAWKDLASKGETSYKLPYYFKRVPMPRSRDQMQTWLTTINYYYDEIQREIDLLINKCSADDPTLVAFPMNGTNCTAYARVCEYHNFCTAWPNPLKKLEPTPLGFIVKFWNPLERESKHMMEL